MASGFVLIGGWVWSERRDAMTRTFLLVCLSFAWLLAPPPMSSFSLIVQVHTLVLAAISLFLPVLLVHFFALFPESRAPGRMLEITRASYGVATILFVVTVAVIFIEALYPAQVVIQAVAALWFAAGVLASLLLFGAPLRRAANPDVRRRLRVAFVGTVLGAGPLAAMVVARTVTPDAKMPGEVEVVLLTLLVPASFAWSAVVHSIFDFRVALRIGMVVLVMALGGAGVLVAAEWLGTRWPDFGTGLSGGALALMTLGAAMVGPASPWLRRMAEKVLPEPSHLTLEGWAAREAHRGGESESALLADACEVVARHLHADGCVMLSRNGAGTLREAARSGDGIRGLPEILDLVEAGLTRPGVQSIEEAELDPRVHEHLAGAGVRWLLPIGAPPRAVMLVGRRLAGSWLDRRESFGLERFALHLDVALENATLRREASSRGHLDRELKEAGAIQAHLLPRRAPVHPTLDCAAAALAGGTVGGDYYDFVEGPAREFTLAVGDAAGSGVPAALVLAGVQARFRSEAKRGLQPSQILASLNQELVALDRPEKFMSLLCARVEVRSGRIWFANAGLTPPLVWRRDGRCEEVTGGGVLLGVSAGAHYSDLGVDLGAGDLVLLYSDGLVEARRGDEMFGTEGILKVLGQGPYRRASDLLKALLEGVRGFADRPLDDITVVVLRQLAGPLAGRPAPRN